MDLLETVAEDDRFEEECVVCGMRDFFQEGGFYYCSLCNTQSQSARLYVDENFIAERATHVAAQVLRERKTKKQTAKKKGVSFLTHWEIMNIVLKKMADQLVEIGFPEVVRDKIFHMYVTFMIRRKAIFVSKVDPNAKSAISLSEPKTTLYSLYGDGFRKTRKRRTVKSRLGKLGGVKRKGMEEETEGDNNVSKRRKAISKRKAMEEEYRKKAKELQVGVDTAFERDIAGLGPSEEVGNVPKKRNRVLLTAASRKLKSFAQKAGQSRLKKSTQGAIKRIARFEHFTLKTALILVFVALRQLGFAVVFSDIIRLYMTGILKFDDIQDYVDGHHIYKGSRCAVGIVNKNYRNVFTFGRDIENFVQYIGIPKFFAPQMKEFVPKYIDEFVLPREFECLVNNINHMISYDDHIRDHQSFEMLRYLPEIFVISQLVIVLKMLFGLDDRTEKFQSDFARLVNKIVKEEVKKRKMKMEDWTELFVIEDWFRFLRRRREVVKRELFCGSLYIPNQPANMTKLTELLKDKCSLNEIEPDADDHTGNSNEANRAAANFKAILEEILKESGCDQIPNLKPYIPFPLPTQSILEQYIERYPQEVYDPKLKPELFNWDFVRKRIDFIWNPKKYRRLLKMHGYKLKIIHGDAVNECPIEVAEGEDKALIVPLFQPYKKFDEYVGEVRDECSSTMQLLLDLCDDIVSADSSIRTTDHLPILLKFMNIYGDVYIKRCKAGLIPVVTTIDDSDSDSE